MYCIWDYPVSTSRKQSNLRYYVFKHITGETERKQFRRGSYSGLWIAVILEGLIEMHQEISLGQDEQREGEELVVEGMIPADTETVKHTSIHKEVPEEKGNLSRLCVLH